MNKEDIFQTWAPEDSPWSAWVKPVLFASLPMNLQLDQTTAPDVFANQVPFSNDTAVIVDLSGDRSVYAGLSLAMLGWRPVPLFNGCQGNILSREVVDTRPVAQALLQGVSVLQSVRITAGALPVFLLDQRRLSGAHFVSPGYFDNRWCIVPQDMPSALFLKQAGIRHVVLIANEVMTDLQHILCRYQEGGLSISLMRDLQSPMEPYRVSKPTRFRSIWYRIMALAGLRRNATGGFGALVPEPSSSHGHG